MIDLIRSLPSGQSPNSLPETQTMLSLQGDNNAQQPHLIVESRVPEPLAFQDFPPEIIGEVFFHSLPDNFLVYRQPSVRIAPMLLCHVCSNWRSIALRLPQLWMRLFHESRFSNRRSSGIAGREIRSSDLEFLAWWRSNLGENPLHLCFSIDWREPTHLLPSSNQKEILIALFAFVRHLELDWRAIHAIDECHTQMDGLRMFPLLESLRIHTDIREVKPIFSEYPIRKLHIKRFLPLKRDIFKKHIRSWSSLTHFVFLESYFLSGMWFDLLRTCVNLQSGYFNLCILNPPELGANPARSTHHHLRQLTVAWNPSLGHGQYLLKNLFLPSLTALRISLSLTVEDLHCILESTPSLVELHLGFEVAADDIWDSPSTSGVLDPLSKYIPNLRYLVIRSDFSIYKRAPLMYYVINLLTSPWLQLGEPTNNVRRLEIRFVETSRKTVNKFRQKLNDRLLLNPIHGLEVAIVDDYEPILWTLSTPFEKREAEYFENTRFW